VTGEEVLLSLYLLVLLELVLLDLVLLSLNVLLLSAKASLELLLLLLLSSGHSISWCSITETSSISETGSIRLLSTNDGLLGEESSLGVVLERNSSLVTTEETTLLSGEESRALDETSLEILLRSKSLLDVLLSLNSGDLLIDDLASVLGGGNNTLDVVLLDLLYLGDGDLSVDDGLDLVNNSVVDTFLNDGTVLDGSSTRHRGRLSDVTLDVVNNRALNVSVDDGLDLYDSVLSDGLLDNGLEGSGGGGLVDHDSSLLEGELLLLEGKLLLSDETTLSAEGRLSEDG